MAIRIRLKRCGAKKRPQYRVVVMDSRMQRDGRAIEEIGQYNPRTNPATVVINEDRALHWLLCGAQPSETVRSLLHKQGVLRRLQEAKAPSAETPSA